MGSVEGVQDDCTQRLQRHIVLRALLPQAYSKFQLVITPFVGLYCSNRLIDRWVNRKDPLGKNIFAGGFLGLDNVGKDAVI